MWLVYARSDTGTTKKRYPRKQAALEAAQSACDKPGRWAEVYDRKLLMRIRYWRDSAGLQYIEY